MQVSLVFSVALTALLMTQPQKSSGCHVLHCSTLFLDKVWHRGLKHKMQKRLPKHHSQLLKSYISNRYFCVKYDNANSELKKIPAGVQAGPEAGVDSLGAAL